MEKFTLIKKTRLRIKVLEAFEDSSKNSSMINLFYLFWLCFWEIKWASYERL